MGIDARSFDKALARNGVAVSVTAPEQAEKEPVDILSEGHEIGAGKVRLLVRDPPKGPSASR